MHIRAIIGFILSLGITILSYYLIMNPGLFHLHNEIAIKAILLLAVLQSIVQFLFFFDLWQEKAPFWNLHFFAATLSIIAIIIFFTLWIMNTLNYNMMPM